MDPFLISDILEATHYEGVFVDSKCSKLRKIKPAEKIVLCEIANYKRCGLDLIRVLPKSSIKLIPATRDTRARMTEELELGILLKDQRSVSAMYLAEVSGMGYKTLLKYLHWLITKGVLDSIGLRINHCFFRHRRIKEDDGEDPNFTPYRRRKNNRKRR